MEAAISTISTLDQINQLANERQRLWSEAAKKPYSEVRYERMRQIGSQLKTLWVLRRLEIAAEHISAKNEPILDEIFDDFRQRVKLDEPGEWRILEGRKWSKRPKQALDENRRAHEIEDWKKQTDTVAAAPKKRAKVEKSLAADGIL